MAFQVAKGSWTVPASGPTTITIGFQAKLIFLFMTDQSAVGFSAGVAMCVGAAHDITAANQNAAGHNSDDNVATSNTSKAQGNYTMELGLTDGTARVVGNVNAIDGTSFTFGYAFRTTGLIVHYLVLGGADLTNAQVREFTMSTVTGNTNYTGYGFDPECILFFGIPLTTDTSGSAHAMWFFGAAKSSTERWGLGISAEDAQTMASLFDCKKYQRTDSCLLVLTSAGAEDARADFVGFIADGFTLNWINAAASAWKFYAIGLKGGSYAVGASAKPTGAAPVNQDISLAFTPTGAVLSSFGIAATTAISPDGEHSFGAGDGTNEGCIWAETLDATINTEANMSMSTTKILELNTGPSTNDAGADQVFQTNNLRLTWNPNNAVASEICYLAFGNTPSAAGLDDQGLSDWQLSRQSDDVEVTIYG